MEYKELTERLNKQIQDIQHGIDVLEDKKKLLCSEYTQTCPFKIGDKVEICGYPYYGEKMGIITSISTYYHKGNEKLYWSVCGDVLKKDGSIGSRVFEFTELAYIDHLKKSKKE